MLDSNESVGMWKRSMPSLSLCAISQFMLKLYLVKRLPEATPAPSCLSGRRDVLSNSPKL